MLADANTTLQHFANVWMLDGEALIYLIQFLLQFFAT